VNANHLSQSNITLMPVVQTGVWGLNKVVFDPNNGGDSLARVLLNAAPSNETSIFIVIDFLARRPIMEHEEWPDLDLVLLTKPVCGRMDR
jgi:hypothetical protein